jgi:hypothetical protein
MRLDVSANLNPERTSHNEFYGVGTKRPGVRRNSYRRARKLVGKRVIIARGGSGIGRAATIAFSCESARQRGNLRCPRMREPKKSTPARAVKVPAIKRVNLGGAARTARERRPQRAGRRILGHRARQLVGGDGDGDEILDAPALAQTSSGGSGKDGESKRKS